MTVEAEIRNIRDLTNGDFVDFEVLHSGTWKQAQIARTAIRTLDIDSTKEAVAIVKANVDRIAAAAQRRAETTPVGEKVKVNSYDF